MAAFVDVWKNLWKAIKASPRQLPSTVAIPADHVTAQGTNREKFEADKHYFQVRVNEMFLTEQRKWLTDIDPMVFVVSEFTYDKATQTVPFLVGPMLLEKFSAKVPKGMIFNDTRVAGLHPYRGGRLSLTVVLGQVNVGSLT